MRREYRDPDSLQRPSWNSLENNYEVHDIAERKVSRTLEHMGFVVEEWGIDRRHEDDVLIYDDKLDLRVHSHDQGRRAVTDEVFAAVEETYLEGLLEIKTKRSDDWFGVINSRHLRKYLRQSHDNAVPTLIYMSLIDDDDERIVRDCFFVVEQWTELTNVRGGTYDFYGPEDEDAFLTEQIEEYPLVDREFRAPDGNMVVQLDVEQALAWPEVTSYLYD